MKVRPFTALVFRPGTSHFYSPPFDTVGEKECKELKSFPFNITHITLPESSGMAASTLNEWKRTGVLRPTSGEVILVIEQKFEHAGKQMRRVGMLCTVEVYPPPAGIRPHERTFPGPRKGRHELMSAIGCQPEPIFLVVPSRRLTEILNSAVNSLPVSTSFEEPVGVANTVYVLDDPVLQGEISDALSDETAIVADGHHRLAAVREIAEEKSGNGKSGWISALAYVAPTVANDLLIGGIHRVVRKRPGAEMDLQSISRLFEITDKSDGGEGLFTIYSGKLFTATPKWETIHANEDVDYGLAADVVNKLIFGRCLGFTEGDMEKMVAYTHDEAYAKDAVDRGEASFSILMPEWKAQEFERKVEGGRLLPQKSTFFYPKIPSGIALYEPED